MISLTDVTKVYPGGVTALGGVTLRIGRGELVGIVGPSGSGKSTMLHVLGTLDRPSAGRVRIDGYDVGSLSDAKLSALRASRIGFVFQQFHLAAGTAALDNVADGLLYCGLRPAERRRRAAAALERVGLGHRLDHEAHELSGGERQRVAIARAVAGEPPLLLADEPTGALDSVSGEGVMGLLRELHRVGTTVVIITHDREIADSLPRQVRMRDGLVVEDTAGTEPPGAAGRYAAGRYAAGRPEAAERDPGAGPPGAGPPGAVSPKGVPSEAASSSEAEASSPSEVRLPEADPPEAEPPGSGAGTGRGAATGTGGAGTDTDTDTAAGRGTGTGTGTAAAVSGPVGDTGVRP